MFTVTCIAVSRVIVKDCICAVSVCPLVPSVWYSVVVSLHYCMSRSSDCWGCGPVVLYNVGMLMQHDISI